MKKFNKVLITFVMLTFSCGIHAQDMPLSIPAGIEIPLSLNRNVSTEIGARKDGRVPFVVTRDIYANGQCILPNGTLVYGTITGFRKNNMCGIPGKLEITLPSEIQSVTGQTILVDAPKIKKTGTSRVVLTWTACLIILPFNMFIKGKHAVIPSGTTVTAVTIGDFNE